MAADKKGQKYWKDNYAPKLVKDKDYLQHGVLSKSLSGWRKIN